MPLLHYMQDAQDREERDLVFRINALHRLRDMVGRRTLADSEPIVKCAGVHRGRRIVMARSSDGAEVERAELVGLGGRQGG